MAGRPRGRKELRPLLSPMGRRVVLSLPHRGLRFNRVGRNRNYHTGARAGSSGIASQDPSAGRANPGGVSRLRTRAARDSRKLPLVSAQKRCICDATLSVGQFQKTPLPGFTACSCDASGPRPRIAPRLVSACPRAGESHSPGTAVHFGQVRCKRPSWMFAVSLVAHWSEVTARFPPPPPCG
jgi:hypothetical protein